MALNPAVLSAAIVADTSTANPYGDGLGFVPTVTGVPYFIKFPAAAGLTYTVSTNVIPGDLVVLGPDGNPLNPGVAVKTFPFTVPANGLYLLAFVANPQVVAAGTEVTIDITASDMGLIDPTFGGGLTPSNQMNFDPFGGLAGAVLGFNKGPDGMFGQTFQYVLHPPDGNGNGLATAAPNPNTFFQIDPGFNLNPPSLTAPTPLEAPTQSSGIGDPTKPITWVGATDAPGMPGDPTQISISPAIFNYASDSNLPVPFSHTLTAQDLGLLVAATHVWESVANVHFNFISDVQPGSTQQPTDVRVGLGDINSSTLGQAGMTFVGDTEYHWDANNKFVPDTVVTLEDPSETATSQLPDGDQQYSGNPATMFQTMLHELGHALGLAHNQDDLNSVMSPFLNSSNPLPDSNDVAAIQSLYGAPTQQVAFGSQADQTLYQNLTAHSGITPV